MNMTSMTTKLVLTIMVISLFFNAVSFSVLMDNEDEISELKHNVEWLEDDRELYQQSALYWQEKTEHYKSANEALLNVCSPSDITKAAKRTPLPAMKG